MADTSVQLEVEDWVRRRWLPLKFGQKFSRERMRLSSGGLFDFDAVSEDERIVVVISTSASKTASGKRGVGKMMKIRSDLYFLLLSNAEKRVIVFTQPDMNEQFERELKAGRVPRDIEYLLADIPDELKERLEAARRKASEEAGS